jgi:hypothetical protein
MQGVLITTNQSQCQQAPPQFLEGISRGNLEPKKGIGPSTSSLPRKCSTTELLGQRGLHLGRTQGALRRWSGRRDSNSRPSAWKADALPIELLPRMVEREGFEPSKAYASRFTVCPVWPLRYLSVQSKPTVRTYGAGDWNRTSDRRFTKPVLYQLSYTSTVDYSNRGTS